MTTELFGDSGQNCVYEKALLPAAGHVVRATKGREVPTAQPHITQLATPQSGKGKLEAGSCCTHVPCCGLIVAHGLDLRIGVADERGF